MEMDVLGPYPSSSTAFDVLISDVTPEDLRGRISQALGVEYLAALETVPNPVSGMVFNTSNTTLRVLVTLPVSAGGKSVATHFIFDTGAPCSYIAQSVLDALDLAEVSLNSKVVKVNGVQSNLSVSDTEAISHKVGDRTEKRPCHFVGLNILGMDFLDRAGVKLEIDLLTNAVSLSSRQFPGQM